MGLAISLWTTTAAARRGAVQVVSRSARLGSEALPAERHVRPQDVLRAVAKQLHVALEPSHLLFTDAIDAFGTFKIPLNLRDASDKQVRPN